MKSSNPRKTKSIQLIYIIDAIMSSKDAGECVKRFGEFEKVIEQKGIQAAYTQQLLKLQEKLNTVKNGLGPDVTHKISSQLIPFGYTVSFALIKFINARLFARQDTEGIPEITNLVYSIHKNGENGRPSRLQYLQDILINPSASLEELQNRAQTYTAKSSNDSEVQKSGEDETFNKLKDTVYNGDAESAKKHIVSITIKDGLEEVINILDKLDEDNK